MINAWRMDGTRMLRLSSCTVVLSAFCAMAGFASTVPFSDSFEEYTSTIVDKDGVGSNGWTGASSTSDVAWVVATNYLSVSGYPLATNHPDTKVMQFSGTISNAFEITEAYSNSLVDPSTNGLKHYVYVDAMLRPGHVNFQPPTDPDVQMAAYFTTNGYLRIWHSYYSGPPDDMFGYTANVWTELQHPPVGSDEWVRVTITMDYLSAASNPGGDFSVDEQYFQVQLNGGAPLTNAVGQITPWPEQGLDTSFFGGSFFLCAGSGSGNTGPHHRYFSSLTLDGVGYADDVVITDVKPEPVFGTAWEIGVSNGVGGTITPPGPIVRVAESNNQTFTIAADPNYTISDVIVDGTSIGVTNSHTFQSVITNHTIAATFQSGRSPLDTWLFDHNLSADGDADGDGVLNRDEYYAGTDPTNAAAMNFSIVRQVADPATHQLAWYATTESGVTSGFVIYRSTNLLDAAAWNPCGTNEGRVNGTNSWTDPNWPFSGPAFYKVLIPTNR